MKYCIRLLVPIALLFAGCKDTPPKGPSSASVENAQERGILIAEYQVPSAAKLGEYAITEVWIERHEGMNENRLVVRLDGPHVDDEPRVRVEGLNHQDYRDIWSERSGPPYEVWIAPNPVPDPLTLMREDQEVHLALKTTRADGAVSNP